MIEIIKCPTCESVFAACVDGSQDREWYKNRSEYLKGGCKVEFVKSQDFKFQSCDHPKTIQQAEAAKQLNLFQ